jgi:hypothetical protein
MRLNEIISPAIRLKFHVYGTVRRNSMSINTQQAANIHDLVWMRKTNQMSLFVFFISLLIVAQHVSGNHVPIIRS